ncbi:MAG: Gfo/Idh/MocA family oxidoreductase [Clostridia bacterium]|nr:Gfo/Idh/MocA family oxidoreductase [Clostridia bacterium]
MKKIIWGMLGSGDVTEMKNGPGLYLNDNCELKGIWNRTYEKAISWSERHNGCTVYKSVDELLSDNDIDIVYIATTPDVHKELALKCIRAKKHVYIEKPISMRYEDAEIILEEAKKYGVKPFVAHYRRALPQFLKAKELIDSKYIGDLVSVRIMSTCTKSSLHGWRGQSQVAGGGHFFEADIHALDALDMMVGAYEDAQVLAASYPENNGLERAVAVLFKWKNGVIGSGMWCFDSDKGRDEIEIFGTKGSIKVSSGNLLAPMVLTLGKETKEIPFEMPKYIGMPHEKLVADVLLSGKDDPDICTLENAMRTFKLAQMMKDAL